MNDKIWKHDYIDGIDLSEIVWLKLNKMELNEFFLKNYYDENRYEYVVDGDISFPTNVPFGMTYLPFDFYCNDYSFLLGIAPNNIKKYTIISAIKYSENYYLFPNQKAPVTYIGTVEVNSYFRNQGIYKKMCEVLFDYINPNQYLVTSMESEMGKICRVFDILRETAIKKNFQMQVLQNDPFSEEFHNIICPKQKILK